MWQEVIIGILFAAALFYLGRTLYRHFTVKDACKTGCGSCAIDLDKIEKQINSQKP
ncbi:MAG TPA: FeoB-associated Cys-rich membrane protein [Cyclobacteriaceae bacterium]|nr:FeoB-associated Cys-rich membrane protein [Cyclobacteriaceae bacterium]